MRLLGQWRSVGKGQRMLAPEGPANSGAIEYLESLAPVLPALFGDGSGDYAIWTSTPEPSAAREVRRKKKAA